MGTRHHLQILIELLDGSLLFFDGRSEEVLSFLNEGLIRLLLSRSP